MKKLKNETAFQKLIRRSLAYCYFERCKFKKNHGSEFTGKGVADIDGHAGGYYVAIEAKMWGNRPSPAQAAFMRRVMVTGGMALFLIYKFRDGEHSFHWVPGDLPFSYRTSSIWIKSGLLLAPVDPANPGKDKIEIIDCSPIMTLINIRNSNAKST